MPACLVICMCGMACLSCPCLAFSPPSLRQADFFVLSYNALVVGAKDSAQSPTEMYESLTQTWSEVVTTFPYFSQALEKDRTNHIILFPFDHGKSNPGAGASKRAHTHTHTHTSAV